MSVSALETSSLRVSATARHVRAMRLPTLPRGFYVRSPAGACGFIAFALALWLVPGALATWLAREAAGPWWALVPALGVLCFVAGQGLHLTGWVGHEGFHFNLFRDRLGSAIEERGLSSYRWALAPHAYGALDSQSTRSAR